MPLPRLRSSDPQALPLRGQAIDDLGKIIRVAVHVITRIDLSRAPVPAPIVCHDAETVLGKKMHLPIPCVRIQWPAVRKGYDGAVAPILEVNLTSILFSDHRHILFLLILTLGSFR